MRGKKWLILLASLALVLLASSVGVTRSSLVDPESSTGNAFQAWTSGEWVQTTQQDFEAGVLTNTVDVQIGANNRDAWDDVSSGSLNQCYFGDVDWWDAGGYQWSLSIPQGATIEVAYISVYPTWRGGATGAYTARIRVEDVNNPAAFSGVPNNIRGRTYWTTTVDWAIPAGGLPIDQWSDSPSIKDLVQHAVNSPGWGEGDYIGIAIWGQTGNGGCGEGINDFSSNPSYAARLHIEYRTVDTSSSPGDVKLAEVGWGSYSSELLINPDAETGDTTGWTAVGTHTVNFVAGTECPNCPSGGAPAGPRTGIYSFMWNAPTASDDWAYQEIDLYANGFEERVNAGKAQLKAGGYLVCGECDANWDRIQMKILLYDSGHSLIETSYDSGQLFQICSWTWYGITDYDIPTNARYVRVEFQTIEPPSWGAGKADDFTVKVRVKDYYPSGTIASQVLDTGVAGARWDALFWDETLPSNTDITFEVRASDTLTAGFPDASWVSVGGASPVTSGLPSGRYMQWRATLTTSDTSKTPTLHEVRVYHY